MLLPLIFSSILISSVAYYHKNISEFCTNKKEKLLDLYNNVKQQHKTQFKSIFYTSKILLQSLYKILFVNKDKCKITNISNSKLLISYCHNGHLYKILLNSKLKPNYIFSITNENNEDISNILNPYLGPLQNFHNQKITPNDINMNQINIKTIFKEYTFNKYDILNLD